MNKNWIGFATLALALVGGIGGALGAVALNADDLATAILAFAVGLAGGTLVPQPLSR